MVFLASVFPARAQSDLSNDPYIVTTPTKPEAMGEVSKDPECFNIINKAPYTIFGSIYTNFYIRADGIKTRHKSNFRLEADNYAQFCTYGPFYDGHKVELVIRTLVPVFDCKTGIGGDITIYGRHKAEGGTETWATCL